MSSFHLKLNKPVSFSSEFTSEGFTCDQLELILDKNLCKIVAEISLETLDLIKEENLIGLEQEEYLAPLPDGGMLSSNQPILMEAFFDPNELETYFGAVQSLIDLEKIVQKSQENELWNEINWFGCQFFQMKGDKKVGLETVWNYFQFQNFSVSEIGIDNWEDLREEAFDAFSQKHNVNFNDLQTGGLSGIMDLFQGNDAFASKNLEDFTKQILDTAQNINPQLGNFLSNMLNNTNPVDDADDTDDTDPSALFEDLVEFLKDEYDATCHFEEAEEKEEEEDLKIEFILPDGTTGSLLFSESGIFITKMSISAPLKETQIPDSLRLINQANLHSNLAIFQYNDLNAQIEIKIVRILTSGLISLDEATFDISVAMSYLNELPPLFNHFLQGKTSFSKTQPLLFQTIQELENNIFF